MAAAMTHIAAMLAALAGGAAGLAVAAQSGETPQAKSPTAVAAAQTRPAPARAAARVKSCNAARQFSLGNSPDTVVINSRQPTIIPQKTVPINDFSAILAVPVSGVIDLTLKLEAKHRGNGYADVIGVGSYIAYQYAETREGLDFATSVQPEGWVGGTNIRDLMDHYGQINIVGALAVKPGYYKFCLYASAHSKLSKADDLAEVLVEHGVRPMNSLRLSFKPGGRVLQ